VGNIEFMKLIGLSPSSSAISIFPKRVHQPPFTQQAKIDATEFWLPARAALPKALP